MPLHAKNLMVICDFHMHATSTLSITNSPRFSGSHSEFVTEFILKELFPTHRNATLETHRNEYSHSCACI